MYASRQRRALLLLESPDDWGTPTGPGNGGGGYTPIPDPWDGWEETPNTPQPPTLYELWQQAVLAFSEAVDDVIERKYDPTVVH